MVPPNQRTLAHDLCTALGVEDLRTVFKVELVIEVNQLPKLTVHRHAMVGEEQVQRVTEMRLQVVEPVGLRTLVDGLPAPLEASHVG